MQSEQTTAEGERRQRLWENLVASGGPRQVKPQLLHDLDLYRGGRGVWVNKAVTGDLSPDGVGIVVSVLHNGSSYDDDLSEDGVIYHFPDTKRHGRDASETAALRNAFLLGIPVFVITHSQSTGARRDVHFGWVADFDDEAALCLIQFGENGRPPVLPTTAPLENEFRLEANRIEIAQIPKRLKRTSRFAFEVGKRCGWRCAVCSIELKHLLDAAHVRGVAEKGSDDPRNGLILCKNHHTAFDKGLLCFRPETGAVVLRKGMSAEDLGIDALVLTEELKPHIDALRWRWDRRPHEIGGA
jgi:hypothetical protein